MLSWILFCNFQQFIHVVEFDRFCQPSYEQMISVLSSPHPNADLLVLACNWKYSPHSEEYDQHISVDVRSDDIIQCNNGYTSDLLYRMAAYIPQTFPRVSICIGCSHRFVFRLSLSTPLSPPTLTPPFSIRLSIVERNCLFCQIWHSDTYEDR